MLSNQSILTIMLPAIIAGFMATFINWRIHRDQPGTGWWPAGAAVTIIGGLLRVFEGTVPEFIAGLIGNTFIVGGQFLVLYGTCLFAGIPMMTRVSVTVLAFTVVGFSFFTLIEPNEVVRTALFTSALALTFILQAPALIAIGRKDGLAGVIVLSTVYAVAIVVLVARIIAMAFLGGLPLLDLNVGALAQPAQLNQIAAFIYSTALVTLRAFGYILLSTARVQTQLRLTATVDDLTGLPNRRAFEEEMRRITPRVRRDNISFGLAVMDIDHFKRINDTHGHAVGDAMLRHFATAVRKVLRDSDFFARIGGEEFVLVATDTQAPALRQAAERIRRALEETPLSLPTGPLRATISAGLAVSQPGEIDYQPVYTRADAALYRAKAGGRNRIEPVL